MKIKHYISLYRVDDILFKQIGPKARKRGYLTFLEFYKICMWKTVRQKNRYLKNKSKIEKVSRKAFKEIDEIKKIKILCNELEGVAVPVASAILSVVYPDKYGIMDIRCIEMLNKSNIELSKYPSPRNWKKYIEILRKLAKQHRVSPREVDMALFAMHRELLEKDNYKQLYNRQ